MTTAIDVAWEKNLGLDKEYQFETKEDLIAEICPNDDEFNTGLDQLEGCRREDCIKCWNREVEEYIKIETNTELTFEQLRICPTNTYIAINEHSEDTFIKAVKDNDIIVFIEENTDLYYDDIPELIKWLQDVYSLSTEIKKNKVEYVDWKTARNHMEQDGICQFQEVEYFIKNGDLYWNFKSKPEITSISLPMLDMNKWILL